MLNVVSTLKQAQMLNNSTFAESSLKNFDNFLKASWSGSPVEFCWNGVSTSINDKGEMISKPQFMSRHYLCMRPFNSNHNNPTDAMLVKITNRGQDKTRAKTIGRFYKYLLGDKSPWKDAHAQLAVVEPDENDIPQALVWFDTKRGNAKLMINLLTAIRLHTCWGLDWVWEKLIEAGFTNEEAILLATNFSWAGQTITGSNGSPEKWSSNPNKSLELSKLGCSKTDQPFSTNYNPSGFKPLFDKKPFKAGSLQDGTPVQPNNFIWHADEKPVNSDSLNSNSTEYKNATLKIASGEDPFGLFDYLRNGTKMALASVKEISTALQTNEKVAI